MQFFIALYNATNDILCGMAEALWNNLPGLLELKEAMELFTPEHIICAALGVSPVVISIIAFLIKKLFG